MTDGQKGGCTIRTKGGVIFFDRKNGGCHSIGWLVDAGDDSTDLGMVASRLPGNLSGEVAMMKEIYARGPAFAAVVVPNLGVGLFFPICEQDRLPVRLPQMRSS